MSFSVLADPPRNASRPPPLTERPSPPAPREPRIPRQNIDFSRILRWSIAASILVHAVVLLISPSFLRIGAPPGETESVYRPTQPSDALEMVAIDASAVTRAPGSPVLSPALPAEPAAVSERDEPMRVFVPRAGRPEPVEGAAPDEPAGDAAAALQPGFSDPRLWITPRELPEAPEPTREEEYMAHLESRINAYNDSMGYAAARAADATDWTVTDSDGDRWGISPEGIHLGGFTIPRALIPIPSTSTAEDAMEARERARRREEIQRQGADYERDRIREERREAAARRRAAQRDTTSGSGGGNR
ncbi:MAG TPA: hypothetical protein VFI91_00055 [Longimicrobiaceae bacterium]|nr:hypothetical protein [Longimicrobiaceae bacterium]